MNRLDLLKNVTEDLKDIYAKTAIIEDVLKQYPLSYIDVMPGTLAIALKIYDACVEDCNNGECPVLDISLIDCLNELSLNKCIELKAYQIWKIKRSPMQYRTIDRDNDYITPLSELKTWRNAPCKKCLERNKVFFKDKLISEYYKNNRGRLIEKKAYWAHLSNSNGSWNGDSEYAKKYMNKIDTFIISPKGQFNSEDYDKNKYIMSMLDDLVISCKIKTVLAKKRRILGGGPPPLMPGFH